MEKSEQIAILAMLGDEGAAPLLADQHALVGKFVDSLAQGAHGDAEALSEFGFGGDDFAGSPFAEVDGFRDFALHFFIERHAEGECIDCDLAHLVFPEGRIAEGIGFGYAASSYHSYKSSS